MNINKMTSRKAMGLPNTYKSSVVETSKIYIDKFRDKSFKELANIVTSKKYRIEERWASGTILALLNDPRIDSLNPHMINIPSARVMIGSTLEEISLVYHTYKHVGVNKEWLLKEYPKHEIYVPEFKIGKYPVTNYEYLIFLKETKHNDIPSMWQFGIYDSLKSNHPVCGIKAESADFYTYWLAQKTNRHFRLPTEYEWEYAARGAVKKEFPWGEKFATDFANTLETGIYSTTPVGMYPKGASCFGCLDMAGNVEEYVADDYYIYPNGKFINDDLNRSKNYRIARGGSFTRYADLARCSRRHGYLKKDIYVIGFRLAESIVDDI